MIAVFVKFPTRRVNLIYPFIGSSQLARSRLNRASIYGRVTPHREKPAGNVALLNLWSQQQTKHAMKITIMKNRTLAVTFLSIAAFAVGCNKEQTTSEQIDKVQAETKQAAQDMKDYTFAQKAEFVKQMQGQLDSLNQDLDQLSAKIEKSSDAVKAEAKPKFQALRDQTAQLNKQLDEARNATESTWDSVKGGFKKAYEASKEGFQQARQWVSDKITP